MVYRHITKTKMNRWMEYFERKLQTRNHIASSNWGAYSFYLAVKIISNPSIYRPITSVSTQTLLLFTASINSLAKRKFPILCTLPANKTKPVNCQAITHLFENHAATRQYSKQTCNARRFKAAGYRFR